MFFFPFFFFSFFFCKKTGLRTTRMTMKKKTRNDPRVWLHGYVKNDASDSSFEEGP